MKSFAGALLLFALAGAAGAAGAQGYPDRGDPGRACVAARAKMLAGRRRSPAVERLALRLSGAGTVRWIRMGAMVTMDYRPDRLDLRLDRRGRILAVECG